MYLDYIKTTNYYQTRLKFKVDVILVVDCG